METSTSPFQIAVLDLLGRLDHHVTLVALEHVVLSPGGHVGEAVPHARREERPILLLGQTHLLGQRQAATGKIEQRVLFGRVQAQPVLSAQRGVHELQFDFLPQTLDPAVAPSFEGIGGGHAAPLVHGAGIEAPTGAGRDLIRRSMNDVDPAPIGHPARLSAGKALVGVGDPPVVLFLVLVDGGPQVRVAPAPELLDELLLLLHGAEVVEHVQLFIGDDVDDVLLEPFLVVVLLLFLENGPVVPLLLFGLNREQDQKQGKQNEPDIHGRIYEGS